MTCPTPFAAIWQLNNCPQCGGDPRLHALADPGRLSSDLAWIVGESDDHIEAAFTTEEAAESCRARKVAESVAGGLSGEHWWVEPVPLNPEENA